MISPQNAYTRQVLLGFKAYIHFMVYFENLECMWKNIIDGTGLGTL